MAPLHLAVATSRFDIASLLMDRAADANVRDARQRTPLHVAALTPNARLVQELLSRRADPFCATELGRTPLDMARDVNCVGSVRALEGASALWQGPVDAFQPKMLVIPSWSPKWLVVLRDRRHNTGPSFFARGDVHNVFKKAQNLMRDNLVGPDAAHQCPHCYKTNAIPDFVESFPCSHCGRMLSVPASLQLALYDYTQGVPDARPMAVLPLPQDARGIHVKSLEEPTAQPAGWLRQKLGGLGLTSSRNHGFSVRVAASAHANEATWDLRFATSLECAQARSAVAFSQRCPRSLILKEIYDRMLLDLSAPQEEELPIPSAPPADEGEEAPAVAPPPPEPRHQASHSPAPAQAPPREPPHHAAQTPPAQVISQDDQERPEQDDGMCVVCLERRADTAVVPCGHLCLCQNCVADVMGQKLCPMCRNEASSTVRIYRDGKDLYSCWQRWRWARSVSANCWLRDAREGSCLEAKVEADAVSYEAAVQTCELGGQPGPAALVLGLCQSRSWLLGRLGGLFSKVFRLEKPVTKGLGIITRRVFCWHLLSVYMDLYAPKLYSSFQSWFGWDFTEDLRFRVSL
ncbi:FANK1 [Symbiodinium necroappetens]|uniref:FANK1 protein n=1 Tax=Symbiodinium necroappetens TaxID=1628268 RepID=A0A812K0B2_9DINO|nr:FANK1 [Symbiodinium necroappetens]